FREREAVRHLFRVASSLDSMVVGEPQILGQVKEAYTTGREVGAVATTLEGKTVLLVGAGKMSELAARHLIQQGAASILVANRTQSRAEQIAQEFNGQIIPFDQLYEQADRADIVITSTGAPQKIFDRAHGQHFLQR